MMVDEIGVDKMAVDETGVDEPGLIRPTFLLFLLPHKKMCGSGAKGKARKEGVYPLLHQITGCRQATNT